MALPVAEVWLIWSSSPNTLNGLPVPDQVAASLNILIIDDHRMFADAMANMMQQGLSGANIVCVNTAAAGLAHVQQHGCDLVLLDLGLPDMDGAALLEKLNTSHADLPVLVCTGEVRAAVLKRVLQIGAAGLITKNQSADEVVAAVQQVLSGKQYLAPEATKAMQSAEPHQDDVLTDRQMAILRLLQQGLTTAQIAEQLFLSPNTVKTHIRLMFEKLGVRNRVECIRIAHDRGYLHG